MDRAKEREFFSQPNEKKVDKYEYVYIIITHITLQKGDI